MTLEVRGIIELFRLVKREKELHREIPAFSVSHQEHWCGNRKGKLGGSKVQKPKELYGT